MIHGLSTNLRAIERSDTRFVADLLNEPAVQAGWGTTGVPVSVHRVEQEVEQWLETERSTHRPAGLVVETLDGAPVGLVIVVVSSRVNQNMATISIAVHPEQENKGYGRDALTTIIDSLFDDWRIHRIQVTCEVGNDRAAHVYESLGFTREATRSGATWTNGVFRDQYVYGLLATDPRPDSR